MNIQIDNIKVIDAIWFDTLGVVKAIDTITNETKFYLGNAYPTLISEAAAITQIVQMGTKYMPEQFETLVKWLYGAQEKTILCKTDEAVAAFSEALDMACNEIVRINHAQGLASYDAERYRKEFIKAVRGGAHEV